MKKIFAKILTIRETRNLINEGYKYSVDCDYTTRKTIDPWSGMPNIDNNVAVFIDKAEAEAFAEKQVWPFNPDMHGRVKELHWGETWDEIEARWDCEAKIAKRTKLEKEIAELEEELAAKRAELAKVDA